MKGSSLQIAMKEKMAAAEEAQTEEESGMDLLAPCDGKITSLYVRDGTAAVEKGSDVKKGDVLIYGWIAITNDAGDPDFGICSQKCGRGCFDRGRLCLFLCGRNDLSEKDRDGAA